MKKLKLSLTNMEGVEVLTRDQLKKVMGGEDGSGGSGTAGQSGCLACTSDQFCSAFVSGAYCGTRETCGMGRYCLRSVYYV